MTSGEQQQSGFRGAINELFGRGERRPGEEDVSRPADGRDDLGAGDHVGREGAADAGVRRPGDEGWGPDPRDPADAGVAGGRADEARHGVRDGSGLGDPDRAGVLDDRAGTSGVTDDGVADRGVAGDRSARDDVLGDRDTVTDGAGSARVADGSDAAGTDRLRAADVGGTRTDDRDLGDRDLGDRDRGNRDLGDRDLGDRDLDDEGRVGRGSAGVPDGDGVPGAATGAGTTAGTGADSWSDTPATGASDTATDTATRTTTGTAAGDTAAGDRGAAGSDAYRESGVSGSAGTDAAQASRTDGGTSDRLVTAERASFYASRWDHIKGDFVDEPRKAINDADALVGELLDELQKLFTEQRKSVVHGLDTDQTSTEDLRQAFRRYRSFFDRLLAI